MSLLNAVRNTFTGRTDKYMDIDLTGNTVIDVTGTFFTDHQRDYTNTRLARYKENWSFYRGDHFKLATMEGKKKLVVNMCRPVVNKSVDWLFGHGLKFVTPPGNEALIPLLDFVWQANGRDLMLWEHGQYGAVTGDAFLYITVQDKNQDGQPLPVNQQRIVIHNLNPSYVHPVYDSFDPREILACLIQVPTVLGFDPLNSRTSSSRHVGLYSVVINRNEIAEYWNRQEIPGSRRENFLKRVPVVHTRNIPISTSFFGQSDIDDILRLNESLNEVGNSINDIIAYHAAPTTVIFGAKAANLEKGAYKVWSGLPKDARVENLSLKGELEAAVKHFDMLKLAIGELSNTPEGSLGKIQQISNTSAAALEVQYLPLIEKTRRKYLTYGATIAQANEIMLQIMESRFGMDISERVADKERAYEVGVEFNSPLPTDEKLRVDMLIAKLNQGLESKAGALRTLGEKDIKRKMLEIVADKREQLTEDVERAVSSTGAKPLNLSVYGLGSYALNLPEMEKTFQMQDKAFLDLISEEKETEEPPKQEETPKVVDSAGSMQ